jgi:translation initiation factor 3 subunit B
LASRIGNLSVDEDTGFNGAFMCYDEEKDSSLGVCFLVYETAEEAKNAVDVLQGYSFDKKHQLVVTAYTRAKQLQSLASTDFKPPKPAPFLEKPNAAAWLEDSNQRDSFLIRFQSETVINWFDNKNDPVVDYDGSREKEAGVAWCEFYCHWSNSGSYLATLVPSKGVILWSGTTYEKTARFVAPGVQVRRPRTTEKLSIIFETISPIFCSGLRMLYSLLKRTIF